MGRVNLGGLAIGLVVCLPLTPALAQNAPPAPAVFVEAAVMSDLRPSVSFTGRLKAIQKVDVRARISGFLQETNFTEGQVIEEGHILYKVEPNAYQAVVDQTQGELEAARADTKLAEIEVERKQRLVERDVSPQSELDVAEANVARAEGAERRLEAQLDRANLDLSYTTITAPFDGIVGLSNVDVGAFVEPASGALTTLTRLDPMTAEFPVTSAQILRYQIEAGADGSPDDEAVKVELILPDGSIYDQTGAVDFIDAEVNQGTDTVLVRAVFDNPNRVLLDGALVGVRLEQDSPEMVLNVAQTAVQRDQLGAFVMVVDGDSKVEQRRVEVPRVDQGRAIVSSGLEEGELVITEGVNKVRPGIVVDAATAGTDASQSEG